MELHAILFDTRSIQKYIFSGNRLKTHIGASYIVDTVFDKILVQQVLPAHCQLLDADSWHKEETKGKDIAELVKDCYIAYIGGGNALVLFKDKSEAERRAIVSEFTKMLLTTYPGLKTGAAIGDLDTTTGTTYKNTMNQLYQQLKKYQNTIFPQVNVPYTGLTLACEVNGEAANFFDAHHTIAVTGEGRFFSQEVKAKTEAVKAANKYINKRINQRIKDKSFEVVTYNDALTGVKSFSFPMELDHLGQRETENDIAIIHIDGNQMGKRFSSCKTLTERSDLSWRVKAKTEEAFTRLLFDIVAEYDTYADFLTLETGVLPIRPLILGGDDVTFICPARLALTYVKRFMTYLKESSDILEEGISSCAGIAILPTSYPFFRGYKLAEQLCDAAKSKSRADSTTCWLDYAILHGEQAPELDQIRLEEYSGALGNMHFGPYRVDKDDEVHSLTALLTAARQFADANFLPRNKVKELRFVAARGHADIKTYMEQLHHLEKRLPKVKVWGKFEKDVWVNKETPYVDAIELIDYLVPEQKGMMNDGL